MMIGRQDRWPWPRASWPGAARRSVRAARLLLAFVLSVGAVARPLGAQDRDEGLSYRTWTTDDGLGLDRIKHLAFDARGYLWIASSIGVSRFDGTHFRNIKYLKDGTTLGQINQVVSTPDSVVWLLDIDGRVLRIRNDVVEPLDLPTFRNIRTQAIAADPFGALWLLTAKGLAVLDARGFRFLTPDSGDPNARQLLPDQRGGAWFTAGSLLKHIDARGRLTTMPLGVSGGTASPNMRGDGYGRVWLWGRDASVWHVTSPDATPVQVELPPGGEAVQHVLPAPAGDSAWVADSRRLCLLAGARTVRCLPIAAEPLGFLGVRLLAKVEDQLVLLEPTTGRTTARVRGAIESQVNALLRDHAGGVWVGTARNGLHLVKLPIVRTILPPKSVRSSAVMSLAVDGAGRLWASHFSGELVVSDTGARLSRMVTSMSSDSLRAVLALAIAGPGNILVGKTRGDVPLWSCTMSTGACVWAGGPDRQVDRVALSITLREDTTWVGTSGGLYRRAGRQRWELVPGVAPTAGRINALVHDSLGGLWVSTQHDGLLRLYGGDVQRVVFPDSVSGPVSSVFVDGGGGVWVTVYGRGLGYLSPSSLRASGSPIRMPMLDLAGGLPDDELTSVLVDRRRTVWLGTNRGILLASAESVQRVLNGATTSAAFQRIDRRDGMVSSETNGGVQWSSVELPSGDVAFATQEGVAVVDVEKLSPTRPPPPAYFDEVHTATAELPLFLQDSVRLSPAQRSPTFRISVPHTAYVGLVRLRYRLREFDEEWHDLPASRELTFTGLPVGRYTLEVESRWSEGDDRSTTVALYVIAAPEWFETVTARAFMLALAGLVVYGIVRWRERVLQRRNEQLEVTVAARTQELRRREGELNEQNVLLREAAERIETLSHEREAFVQAMTAEIRTPLTLVLDPLRSILEATRDLRGTSRIRDWARTADRGTQAVLGMLESLARLDTIEPRGATPLTERVELATLLEELVAQLRYAVNGCDVQLVLPTRLQRVRIRVAVVALEWLVRLLVEEVAKHSVQGGTVRLTVSLEEGEGSSWSGVRLTVDALTPRVTDVARTSAERMAGAPGADAVPHTFPLYLIRRLAEQAIGEQGQYRLDITEPSRLSAALLFADGLSDAPPTAGETAEADVVSAAAVGDLEPRGDGHHAPRLLLVDRSPDFRSYVTRSLANTFVVDEAGSGKTARALLKSRTPDVVLLDIDLADTDSAKLVRLIRETPHSAEIPIVVITSRSEVGDRVRALQAGADACLTRPIDARELAVLLGSLLRRRRTDSSDAAPAMTANGPSTPVDAHLAPDEADWVRRLYRTIDDRMVDPDFDVRELARELAMDRSTLQRRMKDLRLGTPIDLLRAKRLGRAAHLLTTSSDALSAITSASGFRAVSYFCTVFKERYGVTPMAYRERARGASTTESTD